MQTLIKEQADVLLALFGKSIKRSKALEVLSHCYGYPNWDTACKMDALDAYNNRAQHDFTELEAYLIDCSLEATKLNAFIIGIFPYGLVFDNVDYIEQQTFLHPEAYKAFWQSCTQVQTHVLKGANVADVLPRLIRTISGGHGYALNYSDNAYEAYLEAKGVISKNQHALPGKLQSMCSRLTRPIWFIDSNHKSVNNLLELKDNGARFVLNANNLNDDLLVSLGAQGSWLTTSEDGKIIEFVAASIVFGGVTPEHSSELIMLKAKRLTHLLMLSYPENEPKELYTHILLSEIFAMILVVLDDKDASMANVVNYFKRHTDDLGPSLYIKIKDDFEQTLSSLPSVNRATLRDALTHRQKDSSVNAINEAMGLITGRIEYFYQYSLSQDARDNLYSNSDLSFPINKAQNEYVPALDRQDVKDAIFKVSSAKQVKLPSEQAAGAIKDDFQTYPSEGLLELMQLAQNQPISINKLTDNIHLLRNAKNADIFDRLLEMNKTYEEALNCKKCTRYDYMRRLMVAALTLQMLSVEDPDEAIVNHRSADTSNSDFRGVINFTLFGHKARLSWFGIGYGEVTLQLHWMITEKSKKVKDFGHIVEGVFKPEQYYRVVDQSTSEVYFQMWFETKDGVYLQGNGSNHGITAARCTNRALSEMRNNVLYIKPVGFAVDGKVKF